MGTVWGSAVQAAACSRDVLATDHMVWMHIVRLALAQPAAAAAAPLQSHPVELLRGQQSVRFTSDLEPGVILGPYRWEGGCELEVKHAWGLACSSASKPILRHAAAPSNDAMSAAWPWPSTAGVCWCCVGCSTGPLSVFVRVQHSCPTCCCCCCLLPQGLHDVPTELQGAAGAAVSDTQQCCRACTKS